MRSKLIMLLVIMILVAAACSPAAESPATLKETADAVLAALAAKDMESLATYVHPTMGVRFSPYAFVSEDHVVFMADELRELAASDEVLTWGSYDGSGEPIELTFSDYYEEFIFSADFTAADEMAVNQRIGEGNSLNNIEEFYPDASFVEYHLKGSEEFGGMDWRSLRLVFLSEGGAWYLVGVVNDQWTI